MKGAHGEVREVRVKECRINDASKQERTLKSGSGRKVKSRKQAIAIGLSEARKKGAKVPSRKSSRKGSRKTAKKR